MYYGTNAQKQAIKAAVRIALRALPELAKRHDSLVDSEHTHRISFREKASRISAAANYPKVPVLAMHGGGTSTETYINPQYADPAYKDSAGNDLATQIIHEVYEHAYKSDIGETDRSINPKTEIRNSEHGAIELENKFNDAVGRDERKCYGPKPLDGVSVC